MLHRQDVDEDTEQQRAPRFFLLSIENPYNASVIASACGLERVPDRRTFDRRLRGISSDVTSRIDSMGHLFVEEGLVDPYVVCVDSTILKARRGLELAHEGHGRGGPHPIHSG